MPFTNVRDEGCRFINHAFKVREANERIFKGRSVEVRIPRNMKYNFDINLGLDLSPSERDFNRRTFDIN
jgi:hypothetical protein